MDPLFIAATPTSPEVDFRFADHTLSLKGESYPENASMPADVTSCATTACAAKSKTDKLKVRGYRTVISTMMSARQGYRA